jgi:hypothetical protein
VAAVTLTPDDLAPFAEIEVSKAMAMIEDALALAARVAPCIITAEFAYPDAAKAILRGAVLRWHEAGQGAVQHQGAGPFQQSVDTRQPRKGMFWPSEITQLQDLCRDGDLTTQAFSVDTVPVSTDWASSDLNWT